MPNDPDPFVGADVFAKSGSKLRTQMDSSIARHKSRLANETTRKAAFRFTLRDLFWLTVVAALAVALWLQRQDHEQRLGIVRRHAEALRRSLADAEHNEAVYLDKIANTRGLGEELIEVDW